MHQEESSLSTENSTSTDEIVIECEYGGEPHRYPSDWKFGGADGKHPGADERYQPISYWYFDDQLVPVHVTSAPLCDDQAIDEFTQVADMFPNHSPKWLAKRNTETHKLDMFKLSYDRTTDTVTEHD